MRVQLLRRCDIDSLLLALWPSIVYRVDSRLLVFRCLHDWYIQEVLRLLRLMISVAGGAYQQDLLFIRLFFNDSLWLLLLVIVRWREMIGVGGLLDSHGHCVLMQQLVVFVLLNGSELRLLARTREHEVWLEARLRLWLSILASVWAWTTLVLTTVVTMDSLGVIGAQTKRITAHTSLWLLMMLALGELLHVARLQILLVHCWELARVAVVDTVDTNIAGCLTLSLHLERPLSW